MQKEQTTLFSFWFYDTLKLFLQYLSVMYSAIPAAIFCYGLVYFGLFPPVAFALSFCLAIGIGFFSWRFIGKTLFQTNEIQVSLAESILIDSALSKSLHIIVISSSILNDSNIIISSKEPVRTKNSDSTSQIQVSINYSQT